MTNLISIFEYDKIRYIECPSVNEERYDVDKKTLFLSGKSIQQLEKLNQNQKILEINRREIRALNYVGVACVGRIKLEILPKFIADSDISQNKPLIMNNLLHMLKYTNVVDIEEISIAALYRKEDFFEIMVYLYAKNLTNLLKKKHERKYLEFEDDLHFVREKILTEKFGRNPAQLYIIPCQFHENAMNTLLNKILKYSTYLMMKRVNDFETLNLLRRIIASLDPVEMIPVPVTDIEKILFTRLNKEFKPYIDFCKMFLSNSTLSLQASNVEFFSFMIPMEKLFEDFIVKFMQEYQEILPNCCNQEIISQKRLGYLIDHKGKLLFEMRPDIQLIGNEKILIDTKYKLLNEEERKYGVSQSDLYQIYTYCKEADATKAVLLYPKGLNSEFEDISWKLGRQKDITLYIMTVPLDFDLSQEKGVVQLKTILKEKLSVFNTHYERVSPPLTIANSTT